FPTIKAFCRSMTVLVVFFFQAEDGIRVFHVTGVQTCALPIWPRLRLCRRRAGAGADGQPGRPRLSAATAPPAAVQPPRVTIANGSLCRSVKLPTRAFTTHSGVCDSAVTRSPSEDTATAPEQPSLNRTPFSPPATATSIVDGSPTDGLL